MRTPQHLVKVTDDVSNLHAATAGSKESRGVLRRLVAAGQRRLLVAVRRELSHLHVVKALHDLVHEVPHRVRCRDTNA
jgi:ribosomal protein L17